MSRKEMFIDPPEGWRYGFPRVLPRNLIGDSEGLERWLIQNGYPKEDVDCAMKYSWYWEGEA